MGNAHSANGRRLFPLLPSSNRYHRLPHSSSASLYQPLLQQDQNLFTPIEHEVQAYWEKSSALEKEICDLKSKFSRLETTVQTLQLETKAFKDHGLAIVSRVEKEIAELKIRVDESMSTMVDFAAVLAELKLPPEEALKSNQLNEITDVLNIKVSNEGLLFILIFLIGVLIGLIL